MSITVRTYLHYEAQQPCDVLLQIEASKDPSQHCLDEQFSMEPDVKSRLIAGEGGFGTRRWIRAAGDFICNYETRFEVSRPEPAIALLSAENVSTLPSECTKYLMPSRYCHPETFMDVLADQFSGLSGGTLISTASDWIQQNFTYDPNASTGATTATDSFAQRAGVCRDYAHVLMTIARAAGIPARYASVYAPDVSPQDFHAVAEVYLSGAWHFVDSTGMANPSDIVRIGVGRDAADVSFMTSYGMMMLKKQTVEVIRTS
jgi:transglutaminase-like putative cysteine protease